MRVIFAAVVLVSSIALPAFAQAPQPTPTQQAFQINTVISNWAIALETWQKRIVELQKENEDLKKQLAAKAMPPKVGK